ncbi:MAG TPA: PIG-L family deacetylase [Chloroflexota bacterium]|nr:PIG-L family deacetylase [Chloroflexota bacterium]HUM69855.1 PIG-L family deacetylase [Chloroflexota bacterium]
MWPDPAELFPGTVVIVAPHMDDEVLACGGAVARLPQKAQIHVIYATDGMKSPAPILPRDSISADLGEIREKESAAAMQLLGIPEENLHFLRLPEAELKKHMPALRQGLLEWMQRLRPDHVLMPFRFDRHPDHLAINRVLTAVHQQGQLPAQLTEYFVYYRWRLLPGRDVRRYIRPSALRTVDTQTVAAQKRQALDCFRSQTTIFYPWQTRPILTPQLLDDTSETPEVFLPYEATMPGTAVFSKAVLWIRFVHRWESPLQKWKYLAGARLRRVLVK